MSGALAHADLDTQLHDATRRLFADPGDPRAWLHRAELYRMRQMWAEAESDYREAARFGPKLESVALLHGRMLVEAGRPAEALAFLGRFIASNPHHLEARTWSARAKLATGDAAGAIA